MSIYDDTLLGRNETERLDPDYLEEGSGPPVVLVHSSMAGARQWSTLMPELSKRWNVRAVNLFGYGGTQAWQGSTPPSLDDFAKLVASVVPQSAPNVALVGHSLGGAVAMRAAQHLRGRVDRLVLIEPSLFCLLEDYGRMGAYYEIFALAGQTTQLIQRGAFAAAGERFVDYWCGSGTWNASSVARRDAIVRLIVHLPDEWSAVLERGIRLPELRADMPSQTLLMSFAETVRPSRELAQVMADGCPRWQAVTVEKGGHMGPLTHPQLVNPIIRDFLCGS